MWLDSKAVNCPQKWGNFTLVLDLTLELVAGSRSQNPENTISAEIDPCHYHLRAARADVEGSSHLLAGIGVRRQQRGEDKHQPADSQ